MDTNQLLRLNENTQTWEVTRGLLEAEMGPHDPTLVRTSYWYKYGSRWAFQPRFPEGQRFFKQNRDGLYEAADKPNGMSG
jgi:hypothetical protein